VVTVIAVVGVIVVVVVAGVIVVVVVTVVIVVMIVVFVLLSTPRLSLKLRSANVYLRLGKKPTT
jgi:hypothetical protein